MQQLTEKVYECTFAVEAHMVCDLLSRAGIDARVDGEFLAGAVGELPVGNNIKVRVEPARAAEAREVIAEWEKQQPAETAAPVTRPPRFRSQLWFLVGALAGGVLVFLSLGFQDSQNAVDGIDYNGDGVNEVKYHYEGSLFSHTTVDRNGDRKADFRYDFDRNGHETGSEGDDDFDGKFEWHYEMANGVVTRATLDKDGDGRPEEVTHFRDGVATSHDYHFSSGGRIVKREFYNAGLLDSAEFDDDGDGLFERRVRYDRFGEPIL